MFDVSCTMLLICTIVFLLKQNASSAVLSNALYRFRILFCLLFIIVVPINLHKTLAEKIISNNE
jgi:hypothetical protein